MLAFYLKCKGSLLSYLHTYGTNAPYEPSFIPKTMNAKKVAARRYVLIRGLFHLCLVSTT